MSVKYSEYEQHLLEEVRELENTLANESEISRNWECSCKKAEAELATSDRAVYAAEKLITREIVKTPQGRDWNKIHEAALVLRSYMFLKEQESK